MPTLPSNFPQKTQKATDTIVLNSDVLGRSAGSAGEIQHELVLAESAEDRRYNPPELIVLRKSAGSAGKLQR